MDTAWTECLQKLGSYYVGVVHKDKVDKILEHHKRDTVSTFGTRSSIRLSSTTTAEEENQV